MTADLLGTLGLAAIALGTVSVGVAVPWWPWGLGLVGIGVVLWAVWGR